MKIIVVSPRFHPDIGGIETYVKKMSLAMADLGIQVQVVTQGNKPMTRYEEFGSKKNPVRVYRSIVPKFTPVELPSPGVSLLVRNLSKSADLIHAHSYHTLFSLLTKWSRRDIPLVLGLHYHGDGHTWIRRGLHAIYRPLGRSLVTGADIVVSNSKIEHSLIARDFNLNTPLISNGVDTLPKAESFFIDKPVVLSVSRLEPYKRVDTLIRASSSWSSDAVLVIAGDGPDRPRLETLAKDTNSPVIFVGRVDDNTLNRWWATSRAFVSASEQESFGLGVGQAVKAGIPVVASDIPAHRELALTTPGHHLVPGYDPLIWASYIDAALAEERPNPVDLPDWNDSATKMIEIYRSILRGEVIYD